MIKKIKIFLCNKEMRFFMLSAHGLLNWMSDEKWIEKAFYLKLGYKPDLKNPKTFNEKIQWLKLNDRNPVYTTMVDKYEVKNIMKKIIGDDCIIPTLGVWESVSKINFKELPEKFVLKCTHDSGGSVIIKNKNTQDWNAVYRFLKRHMKRNYFWSGREWPYNSVKPRIIAEEYMENGEEGLHDYKIWCFNGKPKYIQYITGRLGNKTYEAFYDLNWEKQSFSYHNQIMHSVVPRPVCLDRLLEYAEIIAKGHPFVRCDFYVLPDGGIRFGEITFYPMSGMERWNPEKVNYIFGEYIDLNVEMYLGNEIYGKKE